MRQVYEISGENWNLVLGTKYFSYPTFPNTYSDSLKLLDHFYKIYIINNIS
jgi:hypothetical protein